MSQVFRERFFIKLLVGWQSSSLPLDRFFAHFVREHRALGSHDRRWLQEQLYRYCRSELAIELTVGRQASVEAKIACLLAMESCDRDQPNDRSPELQFSVPRFFYEQLSIDYGEEMARKILMISDQKAPLTIRTNFLRCTREELEQTLAHHSIERGKMAPSALIFAKNVLLAKEPSFLKGWFEIQDESSQMAIHKLPLEASGIVLDLCAGSGGKSLAIAPKLGIKDQLYLCDPRAMMLRTAKKRLDRAGVRNYHLLFPHQSAELKNLRGRCDWVICDVPCSGTGTLRRHPEMKKQCTQEYLDKFPSLQLTILERAVTFLHPRGNIAYFTCSLLRRENEAVVKIFCERHGFRLIQESWIHLPVEGGGDGFFAAYLGRRWP